MFVVQDWARTHSGDPEIEAALRKGEDPGLALVSKTVLVSIFFSLTAVCCFFYKKPLCLSFKCILKQLDQSVILILKIYFLGS